MAMTASPAAASIGPGPAPKSASKSTSAAGGETAGGAGSASGDGEKSAFGDLVDQGRDGGEAPAKDAKAGKAAASTPAKKAAEAQTTGEEVTGDPAIAPETATPVVNAEAAPIVVDSEFSADADPSVDLPVAAARAASAAIGQAKAARALTGEAGQTDAAPAEGEAEESVATPRAAGEGRVVASTTPGADVRATAATAALSATAGQAAAKAEGEAKAVEVQPEAAVEAADPEVAKDARRMEAAELKPTTTITRATAAPTQAAGEAPKGDIRLTQSALAAAGADADAGDDAQQAAPARIGPAAAPQATTGQAATATPTLADAASMNVTVTGGATTASPMADPLSDPSGLAQVAGPSGASAASGDPRAAVFATTVARDPGPVMTQIATAVRAGGGDRVEVRLDPPELGRVTLSFQIRDDMVAAVVSADRSETAELLRRHGEELQRALKEGGFGDVSLDFGGGEAPWRGAPNYEPGSSRGTGDATAQQLSPSTRPASRAGVDGLDIRV